MTKSPASSTSTLRSAGSTKPSDVPRIDEARIRAEPFRRHDVNGAAEMVLGRRGRQRDVRMTLVSGSISRCHHPGCVAIAPTTERPSAARNRWAARARSLGSIRAASAGAGRRRERSVGRLRDAHGVQHGIGGRRRGRRQLRRPVDGSGRRPMSRAVAAMSGSSVLHTTRCGPPGRDRPRRAGDPRRPDRRAGSRRRVRRFLPGTRGSRRAPG